MAPIFAACDRLRPLLQRNPAELARRLARRRTAAMFRPHGARCLAVRASDTRINLATAIITPVHAV